MSKLKYLLFAFPFLSLTGTSMDGGEKRYKPLFPQTLKVFEEHQVIDNEEEGYRIYKEIETKQDAEKVLTFFLQERFNKELTMPFAFLTYFGMLYDKQFLILAPHKIFEEIYIFQGEKILKSEFILEYMRSLQENLWDFAENQQKLLSQSEQNESFKNILSKDPDALLAEHCKFGCDLMHLDFLNGFVIDNDIIENTKNLLMDFKIFLTENDLSGNKTKTSSVYVK